MSRYWKIPRLRGFREPPSKGSSSAGNRLGALLLCVTLVSMNLFSTASAAKAQLLTVGPDGTHASLYDALRDADKHTEIRVAEGSFVESFDPMLPSDWPGNSDFQSATARKISGGWHAGFSAQRSDTGATRILGRPHRFACFSSDMEVSNLTFDGSGTVLPFGILTASDCSVRLHDVVIENYLGTECDDSSFSRSLIHLDQNGNDHGMSLQNVVVRNNESSSCEEIIYLSGLGLRSQHAFRSVVLENNSLNTNTPPIFVNLFLSSGDSLVVEDVAVLNSASDLGGHTLVGVRSFNTPAFPEGKATIQRLELRGTGTEASLLSLRAEHKAEMTLSDSLLVGSDDYGVDAVASGGASIRLTNLTVTKNRKGVRLFASGKATAALNNSIVTGNGSVDVNAVGPTTFLSHNWIDEAPGFVDAANGDYRLRLDAPAVDSGRRAFRTGLGDLDLDSNPRYAGWDVDAGAYEAQTGTPPKGPNTPPCLASVTTTFGTNHHHFDVPICNCFLDGTHPTTQCSLDIPGWPGLDLLFLTPELAFDPKQAPATGGWQIVSTNDKLPFETSSRFVSSLGTEELSSVSGTATTKPHFGSFHWPKDVGKDPQLRSVLYFGNAKLGQLAIEVLLDPEQLVDPK